MGGTIECESKQGVGTVFTVVLPFRIQEDKTYIDPESGDIVIIGEDIDDLADVLDGKLVLLVEDNELNSEIAEYILTEEGMTVEFANDGTVAVEMLREKGPDYYDYILMDIQMPEMNGYEATGIIRDMYPHSRIPIIALSANAFAEDKAASLEAGMNDHIAKPIDVTELRNALIKYRFKAD